jgi:hypothetical protein
MMLVKGSERYANLVSCNSGDIRIDGRKAISENNLSNGTETRKSDLACGLYPPAMGGNSAITSLFCSWVSSLFDRVV